ncbi:hypothetical protein [Streptosporangium sp. NPDC049078]|uniref:hypothetical protein n=1 Tax=Streptosporangium sp. NPDC049078 TaxID=3155767 RepID=UPI00343CAEC5
MSIPEDAVRAAADALSRRLWSGQPEFGTWMENDEDLARAAVEAAAPLIAADLARILRAEAARGEYAAPARQQLTYRGGLERAAHIALATYPKET